MPKLAKPYRLELDYTHACRQLGVMAPELHPTPAEAIAAVHELHDKSRAALARRAAPAEAVSEKLASLLKQTSEPDAWLLLQQLEPLAAAPAARRKKAVAAILAAQSLADLEPLIARRASLQRSPKRSRKR